MKQFFEVNGKQYVLATDFKHNSNLRSGFNELTMKTYRFDFEHWYQNGYWKEQYIPYSLLDGDKVIANISVNLIDFYVLGEKKRYVQIGTVMTDNDYRRQGLSRLLMEIIISEWERKCDLIYLFANDSVINFYPKFGFAPTAEYQYSKQVTKKVGKNNFRKIDVDNIIDRNLLFDTVSNTIPYSKIAMINNPYLVMFNCTSFLKNSIYYLSDYEVIAVAQLDKGRLYLQDIFSSQSISIDKVINSLISMDTIKVILGFVPEEVDSYDVNLLKEEDTTLFVKAIKDELPKNIMFPILSRA